MESGEAAVGLVPESIHLFARQHNDGRDRREHGIQLLDELNAGHGDGGHWWTLGGGRKDERA